MRHQTKTFAETYRTTFLLSGLGTVMMAALQANGAPSPIVVREQLNQTYGPELISVPFSAKDKECVAEGVTLAGPNGPIAAQLTEVEFWPGSGAFVKSARVYFVVDELKPLSSATYTPSAGASKAPVVASDIQVKTGKKTVEITTSRTGVRFALGSENFKEPVDASQVPGPLQAMRLSGSGDSWAGGSSLTGDVKVTQWSARLTDAGTVFARVETVYDFAPTGRLVMVATVVAGDNGVRWVARSGSEVPGVGFVLRLPSVPGLKEAFLPKGYGQWAIRAEDRKVAIVPGGAPFGRLAPNTSIVNILSNMPPTIRLSAPGGGIELTLASREPGDWVVPVPRTYGGMKFWNLDGIPGMWEGLQRACLPVSAAADGTILLAGAVTPGHRQWTVSAGPARVGDTLERVKEMVLDWPADVSKPHPRLFVDLADMKDVCDRAAGDPALAKTLADREWAAGVVPLLMQTAAQRYPADVARAVNELRDRLALMGNTDVMRGANSAVALYDMLIDSDLISASDRTLFRAQLAYLGYLMDDPKCWSMERGYCSGNPNMSCSYTLSLGVLACALSDHPAAQGWADRATQWMDQWLADEVGPNGEWISEGSHYGHVSLVSMMAYAIAARRAGFHDFSNDPRFKRLLLYFAKFSSARDAWRDNRRGVSRAYGRGVSSNPLGWRGMAAAFFRKSDPELSRTLQWMWSENGYPISMDENRCGALEPYYEDRRLPAAAPAWGSELFPELGAILRAGFNTPSESFIMVLSSVQSRRNLDCARGEVGGIAQWCGRGKPLAACFFLRGYEDRNELLCNGVRLARNWGAPEDKKAPYGHYTITRFGAFAALPSADYVRSSFENTLTDDRDWLPDNVPAFPKVTPATGTNLVWTRQLLFVKDPDPAGPAWLALRDTTRGGNPTAWQFWTFSEKVGTPQQAGNPAAFLADAPGHTNQPARELPLGDRYTALGQFGVDVEYFIASPAKTPRHTLRFGGIWNNTFPDYEDLLHLQLPGDGAYAVALFPRPREEAPPSFTALAGGAVTKVAGAFGSDYAFLSMDPAEAKTVDATFRGTAGSVQERPGTTILALPVEGAVAFKGYALSASMAASLRVEKDALTLDFTAGHQGGDVTIQAPGAWKAEKAGTTKTARNDKGQWVLTVPAGTKSLRLVKE